MTGIRGQIEEWASGLQRAGCEGSSELWQISPEEAEVFGIAPEDWPLLIATFYAYYAFMDIVMPEDAGLDEETVIAERKRWPQYFNEGREISEADFAALAEAWVGLSRRDAGKVYGKVRFWNERRE